MFPGRDCLECGLQGLLRQAPSLSLSLGLRKETLYLSLLFPVAFAFVVEVKENELNDRPISSSRLPLPSLPGYDLLLI